MADFVKRLLGKAAPDSPGAAAVPVQPAAGAAPESTEKSSGNLIAEARGLKRQARFKQAQACLEEALALDPASAEAHFQLGLLFQDEARLEDAADCFVLAVHHDPKHLDGYFALAKLLRELGRNEEAWQYCRELAALASESIDAQLLAGEALMSLERLDEACTCYQNALRLKPDASAYNNLALVLYKQGRFAEAQDNCRQALTLNPNFMEAHHNLGLVQHAIGNVEGAVNSFRKALGMRPGQLETQCTLAHALRDLGRFKEALDLYDRALTARPGFGDAVINRCYTRLLMGDFRAGWQEHESRFSALGFAPRNFPYRPMRTLQDAGRRVLVYGEQGVGDEIMFASCLPDLLPRVEHCVIECNRRLGKIFARSFPAALVHGGDKTDSADWLKQAPAVDSQIQIGSLPLHFRNRAEDFPAHGGYLRADAERVRYWAGRLAALGAGAKIGVSWEGGSWSTQRLLRSVPLANLLPVLRRGPQFVSVQYGPAAADMDAFSAQYGFAVARYHEAEDDFEEMAALVSALDLVISVDTTVVHLAGALGKPVWVLLSACPNWRYGFKGERMPWYPQARLFRQEKPGAWGSVVDAVTRALENLPLAVT